MESITIPKPFDGHAHLRTMPMLASVLPFTAKYFAGAIIMPNTVPPILTAQDALEYKRLIKEEARKIGAPGFEPHMTVKITQNTTPAVIEAASDAGITAGKGYPVGVTNESSDGISDFRALAPVFETMEGKGMPFCVHGQHPGEKVYCLKMEEAFHPILKWLAKTFPKLRIIVEHMSKASTVKLVHRLSENVVGGITAHHLELTLNDVLRWRKGNRVGLNPHHYCQPYVQHPEDRDALRWAAMFGPKEKVLFGSDTAPHPKGSKESDCGAPGVFSGPVLLPLLFQRFLECNAVERFEDFVSLSGPRVYGLPPSQETITLIRREWTVPDEYDGVVPLFAGRKLQYQVED